LSEVLFFLAAISAIGGAIGVVALRSAFYSVLALVAHLVSLSALFLLLRAEFAAAAQVVVYAGAVMVLYIFVVAYVGGEERMLTPMGGTSSSLRVAAPLFAGALFVELCIAVLGSGLKALGDDGAQYDPAFGSPRQIGELFLTKFLFPFEVASFLLLVAAVGAVILARRRRGLEEDPGPELGALDILRPLGTGTMAEGVEGRLPTGLIGAPPTRRPGGGGW
jgi:NADH:ubiquinone oxidoreductase subunit 6 (subunit J)